MPITRKLIVEQPNFDLEFETIQENRDAPTRLYITGEYIMLNRKNKNRRIYEESEMLPAIKTFNEEYVLADRAAGELNHSDSPDMNLERLAHKIVKLERSSSNPDYYIGKSMVLSSPFGKILESYIRDGLKFGMSTKCLGQIMESSDGNKVKSPVILGVDAVYDPSVSTAFVDGILENREYIICDDGKIAEAYAKLDKQLASFPSKHRDAINEYILENFKKFLASI
jgi:hypothetical protein